MKFDPDVDPNIYIHLKNEEELSTDIINKGISSLFNIIKYKIYIYKN